MKAALHVSALRNSILITGIIGCLIFASAFLASIASPALVEQIAKNLIRHQVESKVREKIDAIDANFLTRKAAVFAKGYTDEVSAIKRQLAERLPARLATVIAEMGNLDCECRKKIETNLKEGFLLRMLDLSKAEASLTSLIRTKYMDTATQLTREFRIFTGTNALVFALLILAVLLKREAGLHLLPTAMVLLAAAGATAYLYLFKQNWLHTLVFNDYVGFAYIGYLGIAFAFLADIIFNRGRVTAELLNAFLKAIGSAVHVLPC